MKTKIIVHAEYEVEYEKTSDLPLIKHELKRLPYCIRSGFWALERVRVFSIVDKKKHLSQGRQE